MKSTFYYICAVAMLFCFLRNSAAQEIRKQGRYYVAETTRTFKTGKRGTLRVQDIRGDVTIDAWTKNEVRVKEFTKMDVFTREEAETFLKKSRSTYRQNGDIIEIGGQTYRRDWIKSEFEINVPDGFSVDVRTRGGDLLVTGVNGDVRLETSGGDIDLRNIGGEIDARTSGGDVTVEHSSNRVRVKTSGGDLTLEDIGGELLAKTSGGDVTLDGSTGMVDLQTSGGDIEIRNAGADVTANTSGGDIEIYDTKGPTEVHTSGGDIQFRNIGGRLKASTSGGDIEGRSVDGTVRVSTSGGSIELKDVKGGVQAKTAGGDITVEVTLTDFKVDHRIELRTFGGEITLYIPEKLPATIYAEIENTDRWQHYNIFSDFPLTSSEKTEKEGKWFSRGNKFI
ncbi:MAG: hypothetical protein D6743_00900, partial [Calditrichaeota bacterium]